MPNASGVLREATVPKKNKDELVEKLRSHGSMTSTGGRKCKTCACTYREQIDILLREGRGSYSISQALRDLVSYYIPPSTIDNHRIRGHHEQRR